MSFGLSGAKKYFRAVFNYITNLESKYPVDYRTGFAG
jgi:hypothetical protein